MQKSSGLPNYQTSPHMRGETDSFFKYKNKIHKNNIPKEISCSCGANIIFGLSKPSFAQSTSQSWNKLSDNAHDISESLRMTVGL